MAEIKFETSHNVEINIQTAPLSSRILAYLIDSVILSVYLGIVAFVFFIIFSNSNSELFMFSLIILLIIFPFTLYHLLFEIFNYGQSPGKKIMKIRVVKFDGSQASIGSLILRWILRPVDNFFYGGIAIISIAVTQRNQRIGDLAAGTIVVKIKDKVTLNEITQFITQDRYEPKYPNVSLLSQAQINIIKEALQKYQTNGDVSLLKQLADKVNLILKTDSRAYDYSFLYDVVKDYENMNQNDLM